MFSLVIGQQLVSPVLIGWQYGQAFAPCSRVGCRQLLVFVYLAVIGWRVSVTLSFAVVL